MTRTLTSRAWAGSIAAALCAGAPALATGPCPGMGDCCDQAGNGTPGCNEVDCCLAVCAVQAFCCDVFWDELCADIAIDLCAVCGECGVDAGDCCTPNGNGTAGCNDYDCCQAVCALDVFCCDNLWDNFCADAAYDLCEVCNACGPGAGDCCDPDGNGTPGCEDVDCCEAVCAIDEFCCVSFWDDLCADVAREVCVQCDPCGEDAGDCCEPGGNGTPGCNDVECCDIVCNQDDFCCENNWDLSCADAATELCHFCICETAFGDCCDPNGNGSPGCDDADCCLLVCALDTFCCDTNWDNLCADAAVELCAMCAVCIEGAGSCCAPIGNGTPGCDDVECCEQICNGDAFCCDVAWDAICAAAAQDLCAGCVPCPGACPGDVAPPFGQVNGADLGTLLAGWGSDDQCLNLSGDGVVDGNDLGLLLGAWGGCPPP